MLLFASHSGLITSHCGLFSIKPVDKWIIERKNGIKKIDEFVKSKKSSHSRESR